MIRTEKLKTENLKDVTLIHFDDGKANALGFEAIELLTGALNEAEGSSAAVVLAGRPGCFCAGFDLSVMVRQGQETTELIGKGAELLRRLSSCPIPVVAACTGHAIAAGALLLLAADLRIGTAGDFKVGLNEVSIGLPLPAFAVEMAKLRLSRRHLLEATMLSKLYSPAEAVEVGFLDRLSNGKTVEEASSAALELAERLNTEAFSDTRDVFHTRRLKQRELPGCGT